MTSHIFWAATSLQVKQTNEGVEVYTVMLHKDTGVEKRLPNGMMVPKSATYPNADGVI